MENEIFIEINATEKDMLDALEKGYIKDWRIKPELSEDTKIIMGIEYFHCHHQNW